MTNTGPASAWRFLKRNPGYGADWRAAGRPPPEAGLPFPVWVQTQSDRAAAPWGLLAWENPHGGDEPASPFWAHVPMMDGEIDPPDAPLYEASLPAQLRETGGRLSGLRLLDGALIVKIESGGGIAQVRICRRAPFPRGQRDQAADAGRPQGAAPDRPRGRSLVRRLRVWGL